MSTNSQPLSAIQHDLQETNLIEYLNKMKPGWWEARVVEDSINSTCWVLLAARLMTGYPSQGFLVSWKPTRGATGGETQVQRRDERCQMSDVRCQMSDVRCQQLCSRIRGMCDKLNEPRIDDRCQEEEKHQNGQSQQDGTAKLQSSLRRQGGTCWSHVSSQPIQLKTLGESSVN